MKKISILILTMTILSCQQKSNNNINDKKIMFVNYDSIIDKSAQIEKGLVNELFSKDFKNPNHESFILDSINYYIVEGDILLNEYEYNQYKISRILKTEETLESQKLIGEIINNKKVKWPTNYLIKYCVTKNSFQSPEQYNLVKENMMKATKEWENACNVDFVYEESYDTANILKPINDLTFVVLGFESNGGFIASAFFPYYPTERRRLLIDPSYFNSKFDKIGVLRHELGHVLGFRHEHISGNAPMDCPKENVAGTIPLTKYDPKSVMHYFCGGMGSIKLEITEIDKSGAQDLYGNPISTIK